MFWLQFRGTKELNMESKRSHECETQNKNHEKSLLNMACANFVSNFIKLKE